MRSATRIALIAVTFCGAAGQSLAHSVAIPASNLPAPVTFDATTQFPLVLGFQIPATVPPGHGPPYHVTSFSIHLTFADTADTPIEGGRTCSGYHYEGNDIIVDCVRDYMDPQETTYITDLSGVLLAIGATPSFVNPPQFAETETLGPFVRVAGWDYIHIEIDGAALPLEIPIFVPVLETFYVYRNWSSRVFGWNGSATTTLGPFHETDGGVAVAQFNSLNASGSLGIIVYKSIGDITLQSAVLVAELADVNHPPVANVDVPPQVSEGAPVRLSGTDSYDVDGQALTYAWAQTSGPAVALSDPASAEPTFTAPYVGPAGVALMFRLTVSDGTATAVADAAVLVENVNHPPTAAAGDDQTQDEKGLVALDGSGSADPDGDPLTYGWTQLGGPPVVLSDPLSATPSFEAPLVGSGGAALVFQLLASDGAGGTATDEVIVHVRNVTDPPNCAIARASPALVWPPNHSLVPIGIVNLSAPSDTSVRVSWLSVTQNEPLNDVADGNTAEDAAVLGEVLSVRAERDGNGEGRIYAIEFRAENGFGESCTGTVTVCVPHERKRGCVTRATAGVFDSILR